jgi:uncharacterized protein GlcG (DUF336 family)
MSILRWAAAAALAALPAFAEENAALVEFKSLSPETALKAAQSAMEHCREQGLQVGVAVVDRAGVMQVYLRDRFAGPHVEETARRKAWTAVSFKIDTLTLATQTGPDSMSAGIRDISQPIALGGGVPIEAAGTLVGGIGVSGAPGPDLDDLCARAGIAAIEDDVAF